MSEKLYGVDQFYPGDFALILIGVYNYFIHRITNARAEGINSKIALIEKMAFGYRNRGHLKTAIYFRCGNLQLYP